MKSHWFHILLAGTVCLYKRQGGPILWLNWQFSWKRNVHILITISCQFKCWKYYFQVLKRGKIAKLSWLHGSPPPIPPRYATFSQSLVNAEIFNIWDRPWYSDESFEGYIILLFRQAGFCLIFIFSKNEGFRSYDLLK